VLSKSNHRSKDMDFIGITVIHIFSLTVCKSNPKLRFAGHANNDLRAEKDPCAHMPPMRPLERGSIRTGTGERVRISCLTACVDWPLYPLVAQHKADVEGYFLHKDPEWDPFGRKKSIAKRAQRARSSHLTAAQTLLPLFC